MTLNAKARNRIKDGLKRFQPIVQSAKVRDVNESDTVTILTDILEHIFGYDKYAEITSEHSIRGTYCDLAVKVDGKLVILIEAKAAGSDLKENHIKQAIDYAANQGIEWVILTNSVHWKVFKVGFTKPISYEVAVEFDFLSISAKKEEDIDLIGLVSKEGWKRNSLDEFYSIKEIVNRFTISAVICSDPVKSVIKREMKRISPDIRLSDEDLEKIISGEVIKRDILEDERFKSAQKTVSKSEKKSLRSATKEETNEHTDPTAENNAKVTQA
jgi:hypothetical protein